ncbi:hypothetical protein CONCODRAFT_4006 [Conidiobolus coronatus NRRL 28638]|uniref:Uncharacterized protein n=1 Tax=Conidiobolus coronatus (strain ATCC 28846 / CBS 209.66 / NRRL 28638) TaxID=796925 RepID=A0A137PDP1_CONC2|nr:hypothetical protein CONCODRAFT_4006 [Conidiobolus coronatus NRRL 28638]|eukprot:KXN73118.1 hypothetical protein CONCODRAFT_4006 [Conidiobolus coronatus NRRL 28638]
MGGVGPVLGQLAHFGRFTSERLDYVVKRYSYEAHRLVSVAETGLGGREYLAANQLQLLILPTLDVARLDSIPEVVKGLDVTSYNVARLAKKDQEEFKKLVFETREKIYGKAAI